MQPPKQPFLFALIFAFAILIGLYLTSQIDLAFSSDLETFSGPRAYPAMILCAMLVFNALSVLQSRSAHQPASSQHAQPRTGQAMTLFALLVLFCLVLEPLGYILAMTPLLIAVSWLNGARRWPAMVMVSVLLALTCLLIFRYALNTVLPEGLLGIDRIL